MSLKPKPKSRLPDSVRGALKVLAESPTDRSTINAIMAAFGLRRATLRKWWSSPSDWLGGARPGELLKNGAGPTVVLAVVTALLEVLEGLASSGSTDGLAIVEDRLRAAGAPASLVAAVAQIRAPSSEEAAANDR